MTDVTFYRFKVSEGKVSYLGKDMIPELAAFYFLSGFLEVFAESKTPVEIRRESEYEYSLLIKFS